MKATTKDGALRVGGIIVVAGTQINPSKQLSTRNQREYRQKTYRRGKFDENHDGTGRPHPRKLLSKRDAFTGVGSMEFVLAGALNTIHTNPSFVCNFERSRNLITPAAQPSKRTIETETNIRRQIDFS